MSPASQFAQDFTARAAKVNPSAPSTTHWNGVRDLVAEDLGLDDEDVYVATVSKPGNVKVRWGQSDGALAAAVLIGMHTDKASEEQKTLEAMRRVAQLRGSVAVLATRPQGTWTVSAILSQPGDANAKRIAGHYPGVVVMDL